MGGGGNGHDAVQLCARRLTAHCSLVSLPSRVALVSSMCAQKKYRSGLCSTTRSATMRRTFSSCAAYVASSISGPDSTTMGATAAVPRVDPAAIMPLVAADAAEEGRVSAGLVAAREPAMYCCTVWFMSFSKTMNAPRFVSRPQ